MPEERRILVVDDEEVIAWAISQALTRPGEMNVETARSGEEALELLERQSFDLVVTDIRMKGITGLELLTRIRASYPGTGVIVMTAYGSAEAKREATERGSLFYLDKAFELEEFRSVVKKALEQADRMRSGPEKDAGKGFSGSIGNLNLIDMVQLNCLARNNVILDVHDGPRQGQIGFEDGEIIYAETSDGSRGRSAFIGMLGWNSGTFENVEEQPPERNVEESWESLLMEASDVIRNSPVERVLPTASAPRQTEAARLTDIHTVVAGLVSHHGVIGAAVVGDSGVVIDRELTGCDLDEAMITELARLLEVASRARRVLEGDSSRGRAILQFDRTRIVAQEIGDLGIFLIAIASGGSGLAQLLSATDETATALQDFF